MTASKASIYRASSEKSALAAIYRFLSSGLFADAECALISEGRPFGDTPVFSREAGTLPPSPGAFIRKAHAAQWEYALCAASGLGGETEAHLIYGRERMALQLSFPGGGAEPGRMEAIKELFGGDASLTETDK